MSRLVCLTLAYCLLQGCAKDLDTDPGAEHAEPAQADNHVDKAAPSAPSKTGAATPPLNFSLPDDYHVDGGPLPAAEDEDKNVFNANAAASDRKLKFKPKVHIKEGTTFDSAVGGQGDAIEGAEFGVEYKIP